MKIIKRTDMAVDFVLERVGIAVAPDGQLWRDQIETGMIVIGASGHRLGHVDELGECVIKLIPTYSRNFETVLVPLDLVDWVDYAHVYLKEDYDKPSKDE